jgi:hypothetical protein
MTDLRTFLAEMALDPEKFAEFLRDPESAMRGQELSKEDREALLSGIPAMIAARLAAYLAFPPPYYIPAPVFVTSPPGWHMPPFGMPSPNFVTMVPMKFATAALLYVTAPPPLHVASPTFVTSPPTPREGAAPAPPKVPPKKRT